MSISVRDETAAVSAAVRMQSVPTVHQMLVLWVPLAVSMLMMVLEPSIVNINLGRTPDAKLALAAYGVAFNLAIVLEAPILLLLDASVARSTSRAAFQLIQRFTLLLMFAVTAIGLLMSLTPLYSLVVEDLMSIPADVAARARPILQILAFWAAPIAWRRTQQGLLIRARRTAIISIATVIRLVTLAAGLSLGLRWFPNSAGVVAGVVMNVTVTIEAVIVTWAARRALPVNDLLSTEDGALTWKDMWRFYLPLIVTSLIQQMSRPFLSAGIAMAAVARDSLAAWPVTWGMVVLIAGPAWSLQQLTNALAANEAAARRVRNFSLALGLLLAVLIALVTLTPLYEWMMGGVYSLAPALQGLARPAAVLMIPFPLLLAGQGFLRGILIRRRRTPVVRTAVLINFLTVTAVILLGTRVLSPTGVVLAAVTMETAMLAEVAWLTAQLRREPKEVRYGA